MTDARERDERGRPSNARPRDASGKPLPRGSAPSWRERLRHLDEAAARSPQEAIDVASELMTTGQPFYAHEVLEGPWHVATAEERDFWQGLAQLAVGLTHIQRGNAIGAAALLRRGAEKLATYDERHEGVAVARLVQQAETLAARIEADGIDGVDEADLRMPLR